MTSFWSFWIIILTAISIAGISWILLANRKTKPINEENTTGHVYDGIEEYNNPLPGWWLGMFYITLIFGVLYLVLYPGLGSFAGVLGWTELGQYEEEMADAEAAYGPIFARYLDQPLEQVAQDREALRMGERLFVTYCATCHGSDARGARGFPSLRDSEWLWGGEPQTIKTSIADGRNGVMPPWHASSEHAGVFANERTLTDEEATTIVGWAKAGAAL